MSNDRAVPGEEEMIRWLVDMIRRGTGPTSGGWDFPGLPLDPRTREVFQFLGQAWLAYMASGLRLSSRLAEAWASTLPGIARTLADSQRSPGEDTESRQAPFDEVRRRLRELVDYPAQEARALHAQLDGIFNGVWPASDAQSDGDYWRRWETKP